MKSFVRSLFNQFHLLNRPARLFLLALFFDGLLFSGWNLFFNLYIVNAGYSRDFLGLINAAPSLSALVLGVPMGLISDKIGRKRAMILGFFMANFAIFGMIMFQRGELETGLRPAPGSVFATIFPQPGALHDAGFG